VGNGMENTVQYNDKAYDIDIITKVFERNMKQSVRSVHRIENVANNSVYITSGIKTGM
jgi:hypothetical protein